MLTPLAWLVPHVPTLLVDSLRGHRTPMLAALEDLSHLLFEDRPGAVVVVSARWQTNGPFMVDAGKRHRTLTDYSGFGVEVRYDCKGQPALAKALIAAGTKAGVRTAASTRGVDSGVAVPMNFLIPDKSVPVVPVSVADRPVDECRAWGAAMARAIDLWPDPVLFVVGGLLSFDLHAWQLSREVPAQAEFDERVLAALADGDWDSLDHERRALAAAGDRTTGDAVLVEGELRHLEILRGFLGADVTGDLRCYEAGSGMGAALIAFEVPGAPPPRDPDSDDDSVASDDAVFEADDELPKHE